MFKKNILKDFIGVWYFEPEKTLSTDFKEIYKQCRFYLARNRIVKFTIMDKTTLFKGYVWVEAEFKEDGKQQIKDFITSEEDFFYIYKPDGFLKNKMGAYENQNS